jgi:RHS repeat-associated protein
MCPLDPPVDDLVLRDRDTDANGGLDERLYVLQDANWNVVAISNSSGTIQERYTYSAYGVPTFRTSTFTERSPNASTCAWDVLFTGRSRDAETGFYYYRNRYYGAELGRFINRDPIGYGAETMNFYQYVGSRPATLLDPGGLAVIDIGDLPPIVPRPGVTPKGLCARWRWVPVARQRVDMVPQYDCKGNITGFRRVQYTVWEMEMQVEYYPTFDFGPYHQGPKCNPRLDIIIRY